MFGKMRLKYLNIIFVSSFSIFLLDLLTGFDIKNQIIKSFVYLFSTFGSVIILILNLKYNKSKFTLLLSIAGILLTIIINPIRILMLQKSWKTQTILYENGHLSNKKIEFQMQDIGGRGYKKRTVEVFYLTNLFMITNEVDENFGKHSEWIKVDKEINELKLK